MVSRTIKPLILAKDCETPIPRREANAILWSAASTHTLWPNRVLLRTGFAKTPVPHPVPTHIRAQLPYFPFVKHVFQSLYTHCLLYPPALHCTQIRPENMIMIPFKPTYAHAKTTTTTTTLEWNKEIGNISCTTRKCVCIYLLAYYQSSSLDKNPVCYPSNAWNKAQHTQKQTWFCETNEWIGYLGMRGFRMVFIFSKHNYNLQMLNNQHA